VRPDSLGERVRNARAANHGRPQAIRNLTPPGGSRSLVSKGISYGTIARAADGSWITAGVQGIAAPSLVTTGPANPPSLIIRPFHQAGNVVSIRQFSNNAFNHHHGIQPAERFGKDTDPDGDGVMNEMTRADMTAVSNLPGDDGGPRTRDSERPRD
jgi:hypothetical protein